MDNRGQKPESPWHHVCVQMIRVRGVKVKKFVLNGCFDRLYGTKSPVNGLCKPFDIKALSRLIDDKYHELSCRLAILQGPRQRSFFPSDFEPYAARWMLWVLA